MLPAANKVRLAFEEEHIRATFFVDAKHLHREITPGTIAYFESCNAKEKMGFRFSLEHWDNGVLTTRKLTSDRAQYDSLAGAWRVSDYVIRDHGWTSTRSHREGTHTGYDHQLETFGSRPTLGNIHGHELEGTE